MVSGRWPSLPDRRRRHGHRFLPPFLIHFLDEEPEDLRRGASRQTPGFSFATTSPITAPPIPPCTISSKGSTMVRVRFATSETP